MLVIALHGQLPFGVIELQPLGRIDGLVWVVMHAVSLRALARWSAQH
jgi:hypothetical protein